MRLAAREGRANHYATTVSPADVAKGDGSWTVDSWDDFSQRWLVHHDDLLAAVVLLGEMLGVDWEKG